MKRIIICFCIIVSNLLSAQSTVTPHPEWIINSSLVSFKIKNAGFNIDGSFGNVAAKIIFDNTKNYGNSIDAYIESTTINTGNNTRDGHLRKSEYFDVLAYPKISMKGTVFGKEKDGSYKGYFKLTIKNVSKDIVLPFTFNEKDGKGVFKGSFTIDRRDYGVGESSILLSNNATISITINVIKK